MKNSNFSVFGVFGKLPLSVDPAPILPVAIGLIGGAARIADGKKQTEEHADSDEYVEHVLDEDYEQNQQEDSQVAVMGAEPPVDVPEPEHNMLPHRPEIGRASCRERV